MYRYIMETNDIKTCENSFRLNSIRLWFKEKENKCPFNCYFIERKSARILLKL